MKPKKSQPQTAESVSVRISPEMLAAIDERAQAERRTRGNLIRLLLERAMEGGK